VKERKKERKGQQTKKRDKEKEGKRRLRESGIDFSTRDVVVEVCNELVGKSV